MGKQIPYKFGYINNSESISLIWDVKRTEKVEYRVYSVNGKTAELIDSTSDNFSVFGAKGISEVYVETRTLAGGYLSESQRLNVPVNTDDIIKVAAVKSYKGITLVWSDRTLCGSYRIMTRVDRKYEKGLYLNTAQYNIENPKRREKIKICEGTPRHVPVRLSADFVISEENCVKAEAPERVDVSVIVPAYNNEHYLAQCIDSLLASTLNELEIIIVDDGSTDKTGEIADWYAETYKGKVIAIHTGNQGAAMARNEGVKHARGEYSGFVDSDDFVSMNMYEKMYRSASELDCDIAVCPMQLLTVPQINSVAITPLFILPFDENKAYDTNELIKITYAPNYETVSICDKIYRTELLRAHPIPDLKYEDSAWSPVIYSYAEKFCYVNDFLYCYNRLVEAQKKTVTNEFFNYSYEEASRNRVRSYTHIIEEGDPADREYLLTVALRFVLRQLVIRNFTWGAAKYFVDFINKYKDEINANATIAADEDIQNKIRETSERWLYKL